MGHPNAISLRNEDGGTDLWVPTTLDTIGKDEAYLEETIAAMPSLLRLESRQTGIHGPYAQFRQLEFGTPQGRGIRPDIVILAASGHLIVVEVKHSSNPELRDRRVIAQVVDYAASFSALSEEEVVEMFSSGPRSDTSWSELVQSLFPRGIRPGRRLWMQKRDLPLPRRCLPLSQYLSRRLLPFQFHGAFSPSRRFITRSNL